MLDLAVNHDELIQLLINNLLLLEILAKGTAALLSLLVVGPADERLGAIGDELAI